MADLSQDRPCIHVCLIGGADEHLYRWVEIGAEEEGLPTRKVQVTEIDPIAAAYLTAQGSRFDIGVSISPNRVVLHETHMPATQPVLSFEFNGEVKQICRLMGSNAARMVVRLPLRFVGEADRPVEKPDWVKKPSTANRSEAIQSLSKIRPSDQVIIELPVRDITNHSEPQVANPAPVNLSGGDWGEAEIKRVVQTVVRILSERGIL